MNIKIIVACIMAIALAAGAGYVIFSGGNTSSNVPENNVSMVDGKQIIAIYAKGGYFPKITTAKAGVPTVITMDTQGTFDCSSALQIPSLNYQKNLPPSGQTSIDVPPQNAGTTLQGLCSMGMYSFAINFN